MLVEYLVAALLLSFSGAVYLSRSLTSVFFSSSIDLVNEVITEDMERHRGFPPPPLPPHSLYQPHADNHVTLHPSSSPPPPSAPRPKLVARGTAPQVSNGLTLLLWIMVDNDPDMVAFL